MWKKVKLIKMSNFTFFHNVFYAVCILKSCNNHISVVVCSFFKFGMVSKWCIREWFKETFSIKASLKFCCLVYPFPHNDTFWHPWDTSLLKTLWEIKRRNCSQRAISPFHSVFSTYLDSFMPFSSNLKLSSANSFSLEESKICRLVMG